MRAAAPGFATSAAVAAALAEMKLRLSNLYILLTTESYPEWIQRFHCCMKLTAINQLWVADITYIRLRHEFVYLSVVLDVFSRKVVD